MSEHIKLEVSEDKIAIATMVNGENRFRTSFVKEWMDVLDKVERYTLMFSPKIWIVAAQISRRIRAV